MQIAKLNEIKILEFLCLLLFLLANRDEFKNISKKFLSVEI